MINSGDTAWLLISAALVLLMTPGVAFFYSGLVSTRSTVSMCFICCAVVPIIWALAGFNLVFTEGNGFIGSFWNGNGLHLGDQLTGTIPTNAFLAFQMMFAVITPALIAGSVVGRMRFKSFVLFVALWSFFVYNPIAHWVWGPDGWIAKLGAIDFAGGKVVHINAGFSALIAAMVLGPRLGLRIDSGSWDQSELGAPHNVPFVILGASLLWFVWYGFNAGSALTAGQIASHAFLTTTVATSASILTWTGLTWFRKLPASAVGTSTAAVIGLVAITPAAGYVTLNGAMIIGIVGAGISYLCTVYRSYILQTVDDALDVFICHGVSGTIGALMTGILATKSVNPAGADGLIYGNPGLLVNQLIAVGAVIAMTMLMTWVILFVLKLIMPIRPKPEEEKMGIDKVEHAEAAYKRITKKQKDEV